MGLLVFLRTAGRGMLVVVDGNLWRSLPSTRRHLLLIGFLGHAAGHLSHHRTAVGKAFAAAGILHHFEHFSKVPSWKATAERTAGLLEWHSRS